MNTHLACCISPHEYSFSGEHEIGVNEGFEQVIGIDKILVHPDYDRPILAFDIALLKLDRAMAYKDNVGPICLPSSKFSDGTLCYVTGWGAFARNSPMASTLQQVSIPLYPHDKCRKEYESINPVQDNMICAGFLHQHVGTCRGDSGGPLTCEDRGRWFLVGLTSWGRNGCADSGSPGVYADVFYFKRWIEETMKRFWEVNRERDAAGQRQIRRHVGDLYGNGFPSSISEYSFCPRSKIAIFNNYTFF